MSEWRDKAACRGMDTDLFYPTGRGFLPDDAAKEACGRCEVRQECLDDALATTPWLDQGIRGGLPEKARVRMRRERRKAS